MLVTEDMAPGDAIPTHKHLEQDEIVLIEKGTIHAHVGDQERDLRAGGMVFIPQHTWVSLKNTGTEPASIVAIFSAPGFEDHLRCESVPTGEKPITISLAEENECDHLGHVVYRDRGEKDSGNQDSLSKGNAYRRTRTGLGYFVDRNRVRRAKVLDSASSHSSSRRGLRPKPS